MGASELRYKKNVLKLAELINNIHERHHLIHHRLHLRIEIDNLEAFDIVSKMLREKTVHEISFMDIRPGRGSTAISRLTAKLLPLITAKL